MFKRIQKAIQRYDEWCKSMGLTPDQKRCCVPVRKEDLFEEKSKSDEKAKSDETV